MGVEVKPRVYKGCIAYANDQMGPLQDAFVADCNSLPPCAFTACMQMHTEAKDRAKMMLRGR